MKQKQTNLAFHPAHRELLEQVSDRHGWTMTETLVRGLRLLGELMELYEAKAEAIGADHPAHGRLLQRVVHELGLELLVNRDVQLGGNEVDGRAALALDDFVIVEPPTGELMAIRRVGDTVEVFQVCDGLLKLLGVFPKTEAELDWWPVNPKAE
jgi:hypothetical protein